MTELSSRPAVVTVSLADLLYTVQGGTGKKLTVEQLRDKIKEYTLNGLSIQKNGVSISTSDTTTVNFVGSNLAVTKVGAVVTVQDSSNAKILFSNLGVSLGTSGTVTELSSDVGVSFTRTSDKVVVGLQDVILTDTSTARTLLDTDIGKRLRFTSGSAILLTFIPIPGLAVGRRVSIRQAGAGKVSLLGTGVTLNIIAGATGTLARHTTIEAVYVDIDTWDIEGQVG